MKVYIIMEYRFTGIRIVDIYIDKDKAISDCEIYGKKYGEHSGIYNVVERVVIE